MCVDLRGVQSSVPKHFLDIASVGSVFKHMGSHRVAKNVATAMLGDIGGTDVFSDKQAEVIWCKRRAS